MNRYRYNRQVSPPAPFAYVLIRAAVDGATAVESPAQIDTAADLTVIPSRLVEELQLDQLSEFPIVGVDGHMSVLPTFLVQLQIRELPPRVVEVLASSLEPYVLLGRDVLNHFRITLDGPNLVMDIE
jgi:predicted aspartyl protease